MRTRTLTGCAVALRKESVDRNSLDAKAAQTQWTSLSARRAWIEIAKLFRQNYECFVALRKESVDRNYLVRTKAPTELMSLSARRAWIEMPKQSIHHKLSQCRSPQGERG